MIRGLKHFNYHPILIMPEAKELADMTEETVQEWLHNLKTDLKREGRKLPKTIKTASLGQHTCDVLEAFGLDAPGLLNDYACSLEDALIEQVERKETLLSAYIRLKGRYQELREHFGPKEVDLVTTK